MKVVRYMKYLFASCICILAVLMVEAQASAHGEFETVIDPYGYVLKADKVEIQCLDEGKHSYLIKVVLKSINLDKTNIIERLYYPAEFIGRMFEARNIATGKLTACLPPKIGSVAMERLYMPLLGQTLQMTCEEGVSALTLEINDSQSQSRKASSLKGFDMPQWPTIYKEMSGISFGLKYLDYPNRKDVAVSYAFYGASGGRFSLLVAMLSNKGVMTDLEECYGVLDFARREIIDYDITRIFGTQTIEVKPSIESRFDGCADMVQKIYVEGRCYAATVAFVNNEWHCK